MNKLFTILAMALVAGVMLWAGDAMADTASAWNTAINKVIEAFQYSRKIIFVVGGFGLIALAFFAIFGKIKWPWFAALCVGLGIVAIAGLIIDYVTQSGAGSTSVQKFSDGHAGMTNTLDGQ